MMKILWLSAVMLAIGTLAAAGGTAPESSSVTNSRFVVAEYMRAVPSGPCRRVCVKSSGGTATRPPRCVQWKTVC